MATRSVAVCRGYSIADRIATFAHLMASGKAGCSCPPQAPSDGYLRSKWYLQIEAQLRRYVKGKSADL
eukprot:609946-Amphidinium_carterae.2